VFRKDEVNGMFNNQAETLQNAPIADENYFKVPKVLE
jgi:Asp-tRNA(Asn)/Glu-tRNA(Gln) amidotransferase C subunit